MVRNIHWLGIGAVSAVLMATVVAGCGNQNTNPDNIAGAPTSAGNTTASVPPMNTTTSVPPGDTTTSSPPMNTATGPDASSTASTGAFDAAANTWSQVEAARVDLDTAIKAKQLDQVHKAASKISDLVKTLPDKSSQLAEDKRKTLDAHVKNVGELAAMMAKLDDPNDMKSVQEHQTAMNDALDMMKGIYPAEAMQSSMHMPNMSASGKGTGDKMGGMGKPADSGKMPGIGDKGGKMGGMGMMDKMMPGMGKPADTGKKPDPGKQADPNGKPMSGGGMGGDM